MIEHLNKIKPEIVELFLHLRDSQKVGIPEILGEYILEINEASNLHRRYQSITECSVMLRRVYPKLSLSTCRSRVYDAINYFNSDCTVTSEAWNLYFADQMMKLSEVNLVAHDMREARICMEKAREYRIAASANAIDPEKIKFRTQLVSPDMEIDRMGIKRNGLLGAYKKAVDIIESRDISPEDKKRLRVELDRELNIEDKDYE